MWQLMYLSSTGIAKSAIYSVTFAASYDFWRDFADKSVLNVLVDSYQWFAVLEPWNDEYYRHYS